MDQLDLTPESIAMILKLGHGGWLDIRFSAIGPDWCELTLPWREELLGDSAERTLASGPIVSLMDTATSLAAWSRIGSIVPQATLDLRIDYMRPSREGAQIIGRGECYRLTRSICFVRGAAHDGNPDDPVAHVAGCFIRTGGPTP